MPMNDNDIKKPYTQWMEAFVQNVYRVDPVKISVSMMLEDGSTMTGYYDCTVNDKILLAGVIQQDAMLDTVQSNWKHFQEDWGGES